MLHRTAIITDRPVPSTKSKMGRPEIPVVLAEEALIDAQLATERAIENLALTDLVRCAEIVRALRRNMRVITTLASHMHRAA